MRDPNRRRFSVAALALVAVVSWLVAFAALRFLPLPWGAIVAFGVAIGVGFWGGQHLRRVRDIR